jgi:hypothetical protein
MSTRRAAMDAQASDGLEAVRVENQGCQKPSNQTGLPETD